MQEAAVILYLMSGGAAAYALGTGTSGGALAAAVFFLAGTILAAAIGIVHAIERLGEPAVAPATPPPAALRLEADTGSRDKAPDWPGLFRRRPRR